MTSEAGYSSLKVLVVLLLLSVLAIGIAGLYHYAVAPLQDIRVKTEAAKAMKQAVASFKELRKTDSTPTADGKSDPIWQLDKQVINGWTVKLQDESSRLNLNWINYDIIANTPLINLLQNNKTVDELKQQRQDVGYSYDFKRDYNDFFDPEAMDRFFTPYSFANVSVSFENCLEDLYRFRTDNKGDATGFHAAVTAHLEQKKLWTADELDKTLSFEKDRVYPYINTWPSLNVNYVDKDTLMAILKYPFPDGLLPNAAGIGQSLLEMRDDSEITLDILKSKIVFSADQQKRVLEFLGARTWIFSITLSQEKQPSIKQLIFVSPDKL